MLPKINLEEIQRNLINPITNDLESSNFFPSKDEISRLLFGRNSLRSQNLRQFNHPIPASSLSNNSLRFNEFPINNQFFVHQSNMNSSSFAFATSLYVNNPLTVFENLQNIIPSNPHSNQIPN